MEGSIFLLSQKPNSSASTTPASLKSEKFRNQIRRQYREKSFRNLRNAMLTSIRDQQLIEWLQYNQQQLLNQKQRLIDELFNTIDRAQILYQIERIKIQPYLIQVLEKLDDYNSKIKILKFLVHLTYYCPNSFKRLIEQKFLLLLISQLQILQLNNNDPLQVEYLLQVICLTQNLTDQYDEKFHNLIMNSNFCPLLNYKIKKVIQSKQIQIILNQTINLYTNLINQNSNRYSLERSKDNIMFMLNQQRFVQHTLDGVIKCLIKTIEVQQLFQLLLDKQIGFVNIFLDLPNLIKSSKIKLVVSLSQKLIVQLMLSDRPNQGLMLLEEIGLDFIYNHIMKVLEQTNKKQTIIVFKLVAFTIDYIISGLNYDQTKNLISKLMQMNFFHSPQISQNLVNILLGILNKNHKFVEDIMESKAIDGIQILLQCQINDKSLIYSMRLLLALISCQEQLRNQKYNAIIRLIYSRRIKNTIQKLQYNRNADVSETAQKLLNIVTQYDIQIND